MGEGAMRHTKKEWRGIAKGLPDSWRIIQDRHGEFFLASANHILYGVPAGYIRTVTTGEGRYTQLPKPTIDAALSERCDLVLCEW